VQCFVVDSFTAEAFRGNPAGICLPEHFPPDVFMLAVAAELNLSETAFVCPQPERGGFFIRYFSPKMEIPLCGHATLAAARVIHAQSAAEQISFTTGHGVRLPVRVSPDWVEMRFPIYTTTPSSAPQALLDALGLHSIVNAVYNDETRILLLEINSHRELAGLRPDFAALLCSHETINGVLVTAPADDGFDFHSRYFWPWSGTNEDPVTGGTHTFLAPYWSVRLGKRNLRSFQSSVRSGSMDLELTDQGLLIRSQALITVRGELLINP
jgi:PhzF family phenazine biosynthesis protein